MFQQLYDSASSKLSSNILSRNQSIWVRLCQLPLVYTTSEPEVHNTASLNNECRPTATSALSVQRLANTVCLVHGIFLVIPECPLLVQLLIKDGRILDDLHVYQRGQ